MKTYTLEITAEELECYPLKHPESLSKKFVELQTQARADREADELRLPWKADRDRVLTEDSPPYRWLVIDSAGLAVHRTERAAKLMSAAPELLEAVLAAKEVLEWFSKHGHDGTARPRDLIERALNKVETCK